ncbi:MAG: monovalent cation:proton antiporter-2 (CPA2) family protein [Pseudomonadota bacterium]
MNHDILLFLVVVFSAALIAVPITTRLGLGSVIGYLVAGLIIGPEGLKLISNPENILHLAEFGVVLLLFMIGLELNPKNLWKLRRSIFGLGTIQVVLTACAACLLLTAIGWDLGPSLVAGLGFSMSSTAIVMQIVGERGIKNTTVGKSSFSVLLFQDISVVPIMVLVSLLAVDEVSKGPEINPIAAILSIIGIIVGGRYLSRPIFRWVAGTKSREVSLALALLIVVGISYIMTLVGLSMALGAFLAGVILAESEYRHELEANIEPFKGILLGLFFLAVGMGIKITILLASPLQLLGLVTGLIVLKIVLLSLIARFFEVEGRDRLLLGILLSQGGEFAFVLFSSALNSKIISPELAALLNGAVTVSMLTTPLLLILYDRWAKKCAIDDAKPENDKISNDGHPVIIAGFGRMGQIIARLLHLNKFSTTIIDHSPDNIERVRRFGFKAYYGDATQLALLEAAGIQDAKLFVIAIDDRERIIEMVDIARSHFPNIPILARAFDRNHAYELLKRNVTYFERETFGSALNMGESALKILGIHPFKAHRTALHFKRYDAELIQKQFAVHTDEKEVISTSRAAREQLEKLFMEDSILFADNSSSNWD